MPRPYVLQVILPELPSNRGACDGQHTGEIALHQSTDGPAAELEGEPPAGGPDAALPSERHRAPAAPTAPSPTAPGDAVRIAASTSSGVMARTRMSFRNPSLVSATTAFAERTSLFPGRPSR